VADAAPPTPPAPRGRDNFDAFYVSTPPWDIGRPQPAFARLDDDGKIVGRVLDVGCGTGEHTLMVAGRPGGAPTGIDSSTVAIEIAERKASERGLEARFLVADALDLPTLGQTFDTVLDCGLFHLFTDDDRAIFARGLARVMESGATYYVLCFSDEFSGDIGPRRVSRAELEATFVDEWIIRFIERARIETTRSDLFVPAWLAGVERV
jgi:ubiquinone/menaquinone biosynthesis C-methylase UbiE